MSDPRIERLRAAALAYRDDGDRAHLDLLRQHGERDVAHALTMERAVSGEKRSTYTADVDRWLASLPA